MLRGVNTIGARTSFPKQTALTKATPKESADHVTHKLKTFFQPV